MEEHIGTLIIICILLCFSAFFSASETAYTSANRIRLRSRAENGEKSAARALKIMEAYDKTLTTILVGNNIVNILTSSLATVMCIALCHNDNDLGSLVSTIATTVVVLIFGEILPKTLAKSHAEAFACAISGVMLFLMTVFTPISAFFLLLQKGANKLFSSKTKEVSMTEQELISIIDEIEDEGVLEEQEGSLVRSALVFDETIVSQVITPRVNIVAVEIDADIEKVKELFLAEQYSRLPVYRKTVDHIVGVITQHDLFEKMICGKQFTVRDIMQDTMHIPNMMKISEVMKLMQKNKIHLAVVVDQYGGTEGIVTLEDIIEELVGEIWDESDEVVSPVRIISDTMFEAGGDVSLNDFNRFFEARAMGCRIAADCNTIGGWLCELFGRMPEVDDTIRTDDFQVTVKSLQAFRVGTVQFEIL